MTDSGLKWVRYTGNGSIKPQVTMGFYKERSKKESLWSDCKDVKYGLTGGHWTDQHQMDWFKYLLKFMLREATKHLNLVYYVYIVLALWPLKWEYIIMELDKDL